VDCNGNTGVNFVNVQSARIDVCKYEDLNANGSKDTNECGLSGWTISIGGLTSGTCPTGDGGCASFFVLPGSYNASELLKVDTPPWFNTDPGLNGQFIICLPNTCPVPGKSGIDVSAGGSTEVDFGNLQSAEKHGQKFYDANADGVNSDDQVVSGVKITLTGTDLLGNSVNCSTYTDSSGNYAFTAPLNCLGYPLQALLPSCRAAKCSASCPESGYTVTETEPNGKWHNTTPSSINFGLDSGEVETGNDFGNVCVGAGGGLTLGFWSNKNGQALETAADFVALTALYLRNANGSDRDFTGTLAANKTALNSWLLSANATNMANMLSAQLTAMELNVSHSKVSGSAIVFAGSAPANCSVPGLNGFGFISITNLMDDANSASNHSLASDAVTVASGDARSCQEFMKTTLDKGNNNLNFVQAAPCQ
jgi:hypothetical protein